VEGKIEQVVMVCANAKGRRVVEHVFPDVKWATDDIFASVHSSDWLFCHVRVTKLPPHLEAAVPLAFANVDSLGLAVAVALQRHAEPMRVIHYLGYGSDLTLRRYVLEGPQDYDLHAEYMPPGIHGVPESMH
jgi:hypothetical protein